MGQVPPPYPQYGPVKRKSNVALIVTIVLICILVPCLGCLGFIWYGFNKVRPFAGCLVNFSAAQYAVLDYADDHNGTLPKADLWQEAVRPYFVKELQSKQFNTNGLFKTMDPNGLWGCDNDAGNTGMAFNSDLSGKKIDDLKNPAAKALIFEIPNPSMNAHEPYKDRGLDGPKFFGKNRPWLVAYATRGMMEMGGSPVHVGGGNFNVDVNSDSSRSAKSDSTTDDGGSVSKSSGSSKTTGSSTRTSNGVDDSASGN